MIWLQLILNDALVQLVPLDQLRQRLHYHGNFLPKGRPDVDQLKLPLNLLADIRSQQLLLHLSLEGFLPGRPDNFPPFLVDAADLEQLKRGKKHKNMV